MTIERKANQRRSREEWHSILQEQQQSGLTQSQFCQSRGLSLASFYSWKQKLKPVSPDPIQTSSQESWLELPVQGAKTSDSSWDIELKLPGNIILRMRQ